MATSRLCSIPDCDKPARNRGWCSMHYWRWSNYGEPTALTRRQYGGAQKFLREVVLTYQGDDCLTWPFARVKGYGQIRINKRTWLVTRIVCEHVNGPPPTPSHSAAHECGNGHEGCCNPRHLTWKSARENSGDRLRHGTHLRGERQNGAKLTESDIHDIRAMQGTMTQSAIAAHFGVDQSHISDIHRRKIWAWLPD
jgi:hypothetical protein